MRRGSSSNHLSLNPRLLHLMTITHTRGLFGHTNRSIDIKNLPSTVLCTSIVSLRPLCLQNQIGLSRSKEKGSGGRLSTQNIEPWIQIYRAQSCFTIISGPSIVYQPDRLRNEEPIPPSNTRFLNQDFLNDVLCLHAFHLQTTAILATREIVHRQDSLTDVHQHNSATGAWIRDQMSQAIDQMTAMDTRVEVANLRESRLEVQRLC